MNATAPASPAIAIDPYRVRTLIAVARSWRAPFYPRSEELAQVTGLLGQFAAALSSYAERRCAALPQGGPAQRRCQAVIEHTAWVQDSGPGPGLHSATVHAISLAGAVEALVREIQCPGQA
ncbi:DUF6415 family natural product biosynthesis protein [Streptomyces sp. H27-D2]|uniref:DUF6415 family natural product biosynthesis protein n=1 Tax=Streptomyces sp. H27-D2 TaxID=3046304 RepID=UPI002DB87F4E|nr:DUF6415 family natural product biosynthesis protein [Streptomyces sp. H27-D2]MEC4019699.1 DUF6415 family natural product biosynthesis protein [Streptomyces sp. H27-D2]